MTPFEVTWPIFKQYVQDKDLSIQWIDINNHYHMYAVNGEFKLTCILHKLNPAVATEVADFETNFKSLGNKSTTGMDFFQRMSTEGKIFASGTSMLSIGLITEFPVFYLRNNSSSKRMYIFRAVFSTDSVQVLASFRFYANPTVSANGTAVPIRNQKQNSSNTSEAQCFMLPTVTSNGNFITQRVVPPGVPTQTFDIPYLYILDPGQSCLFTSQSSIKAGATQCVVVWAEL